MIYLPVLIFYFFSVVYYKSIRPGTRVYPFKYLGYSLLVILLVVRWNVGTDFESYHSIYKNLNNIHSGYVQSLEYLFLTISRFIANYHYSFYVLTAIFSIFTMGIYFLGLEFQSKNKNIPLVFVLFVLTGTYFFIFNGIRQAVALSLVFFSFRYIESRKLVPFLLIIAFAYLFHRSVLLVAPIYFVYKLNLSKFQLYMLIAISGICGFFGLITIFLSQFLELLGSKYAYYILKPVDTIGSGLAVYIYVILAVIAIFFSKTNDRNYKFYMTIFTIGVCFRLLSFDNYIFARLGSYFFLSDIVFVPLFISKLRNNKLILSSLFIGVYTVFFIKSFISGNGLHPFSTYLL